MASPPITNPTIPAGPFIDDSGDISLPWRNLIISLFRRTGAPPGPTWTSGTVAPTATAPVGSLYSRLGGAVGATLYVSRGAGAWLAVAGV